MSVLGWTALGTGGLAVALAITCMVLALRISGLKDALAAIDGARAELKHQVAQLDADRALATSEAAELRARYERQLSDLRREMNTLRQRHLAGASNEELRDMFDQLLGRK